MISNHRGFFHVFGYMLAFSGSGLSFSAAAQDAPPTPMLNPHEFSAVAIPDNFDVSDYIAWGAKALLNHSDLKEIVPVFGYRSSDVCNRDNGGLALNLPDAGPGALLLDVEEPKSGRAVWFNALEDVCIPGENKGSDNMIWNTSDNANSLSWEYVAAKIGKDLLTKSQQTIGENAQPEHYILTVGHLPGVTEVGSYWWICNTERPPTVNNSACHVTLSASPYIQHRSLLQ